MEKNYEYYENEGNECILQISVEESDIDQAIIRVAEWRNKLEKLKAECLAETGQELDV